MKWVSTENIPEMGIYKGVTYDWHRSRFKDVDALQGRRRCTSTEREAFENVEAAASLLILHVDELKNLCKHKRKDKDLTACWAMLNAAKGLLCRALGDMSCNMSSEQLASMKEKTKGYKIAISEVPEIGNLSVRGKDMTGLVDITQHDHCSCCTMCNNPIKYSKCPIYTCFESLGMTIVEHDESIKGLCPYHIEEWATEEEMSL